MIKQELASDSCKVKISSMPVTDVTFHSSGYLTNKSKLTRTTQRRMGSAAAGPSIDKQGSLQLGASTWPQATARLLNEPGHMLASWWEEVYYQRSDPEEERPQHPIWRSEATSNQ